MKQHNYTPRQRKRLLTETLNDLTEQNASNKVIGNYFIQLKQVEQEIIQENAKKKAYRDSLEQPLTLSDVPHIPLNNTMCHTIL